MSGVGIVSERGGGQETEGEPDKELVVRPTHDEELPWTVQAREKVLVVFRLFATVVSDVWKTL